MDPGLPSSVTEPASPPPPEAGPAKGAVLWMPIVAIVFLATLGLFPGIVSTSCALPSVIGIFGLVGAAVWFRAVVATKTRWWVALGLAAAVVGVAEAANYKMIAKAVFPLFRSDFERRALSLRTGERIQNERIGIYHVDEIAAEKRGGIYFRISRGGFMLSEDSVGFVYRPNPEGSPWGDERYWLMPIDQDWSVFGASSRD